VLEQGRRAKNATTPIPPVLPNDPRVRDLVIAPRSLGAYDALAGAGKNNDTEESSDE